MPDEKTTRPTLSDFIEGKLDGSAKQSLLDFIEYCKANKMPIRLSSGYLWGVYYKGKRVATIEITVKGVRRGQYTHKDDSWIIGVSYVNFESNEIENLIKNENLSETICANITYCKGCLKGCVGNQSQGITRKIAGKVFNKVCLSGVGFKNPDVEALDCVKKLMEIRKNHILESLGK